MIIFSIRLRALFEPNIFALSNPFFPSGYLFINAVPFYFRIISFDPIFLGFLLILSTFMISHNLAVAAVYWLFSLVEFSRLIGLFSDAFSWRHFMPLLSDFSAVNPAIFNHFCQCICALLFNNIFINIQWIFYLIIEFKLSKLLSRIVLLLRLN